MEQYLGRFIHYNIPMRKVKNLIRPFIITIFLLFTCFISKSQNSICGHVYNLQTKAPIKYATIYNLNNKSGAYSDASGAFLISGNKSDTTVISCVGYETITVFASTFNCDTLFLQEKIKELVPVSVQNYYWLKNKKVIQPTRFKKGNHTNWIIPGVTLIKYFPNPDTATRWIIGEFRGEIYQSSENYVSRLIRIHIYNALPGNEIGEHIGDLKDEIFILGKFNDNEFVFDLNKYKIVAPATGYFIGLEVVGFADNNIAEKGRLGILSTQGDPQTKTYIKYFLPEFRKYSFVQEKYQLNLNFATSLYEFKK